jgi:hypothetical protein
VIQGGPTLPHIAATKLQPRAHGCARLVCLHMKDAVLAICRESTQQLLVVVSGSRSKVVFVCMCVMERMGTHMHAWP